MDAMEGDRVFYAAAQHEVETRRRWDQLQDARLPTGARDPDPGVAVHHGPRGTVYAYRPGQVLCAMDDTERVGNLLADAGVRADRLPRSGRHPLAGDRRGRVTERVVRWRVPPGVSVPGLVRGLRDASRTFHDPAVRVRPNHVFFGAQGWIKFGPAGSPIPLSRSTFTTADFRLGADAGRGVEVAVIDTGIIRGSDTLHPILRGRFLEGDAGEQTGPDFDPLYDAGRRRFLALEGGHGTFITGVVAMTAPGARINNESSVDAYGATDEVMLTEDLPDAMASASVISMSFGGPTEDDQPPLVLQDALATVPPDRVVVGAAGNDGSTRPFWPAAFASVLGVGAVELDPVDDTVTAASFTNSGPWVDCCADGVDVESTFAPGTYVAADGTERQFDAMARWSGTSFAAPRVAALVAAAMTTWGVSATEARDRLLARSVVRCEGLGPFVGEHLLRS